jgi:hypothetical protein
MGGNGGRRGRLIPGNAAFSFSAATAPVVTLVFVGRGLVLLRAMEGWMCRFCCPMLLRWLAGGPFYFAETPRTQKKSQYTSAVGATEFSPPRKWRVGRAPKS